MSNASAIHPRGNCEDHGDREVELSGPCETLGVWGTTSGMLTFDDIALHGRECTELVADVIQSETLSLASSVMEVCLLLTAGGWKFGDVI